MNNATEARVAALLAAATRTDTKMGDKTTVVLLKLPNGFELVESAACVDPMDYDHNLGVSICMDRLTAKLWLLEGYRVQCQIADERARGLTSG